MTEQLEQSVFTPQLFIDSALGASGAQAIKNARAAGGVGRAAGAGIQALSNYTSGIGKTLLTPQTYVGAAPFVLPYAAAMAKHARGVKFDNADLDGLDTAMVQQSVGYTPTATSVNPWSLNALNNLEDLAHAQYEEENTVPIAGSSDSVMLKQIPEGVAVNTPLAEDPPIAVPAASPEAIQAAMSNARTPVRKKPVTAKQVKKVAQQVAIAQANNTSSPDKPGPGFFSNGNNWKNMLLMLSLLAGGYALGRH